jgi:transcriptional antiterminator RfaH
MSSASDWYLVHTQPRREMEAEQSLARLGVETFFPRLRQQRIVRRRPQVVTGPLFPGYVFARFDPGTRWRAVNFAHGVTRVVMFGETPAMVTDDLVAGIAARMEDGAVVVRPKFGPGDRVRVTWGPLEGLEAIFERELTDQQRVVLLFRAAAFPARVVVDASQIERAS